MPFVIVKVLPDRFTVVFSVPSGLTTWAMAGLESKALNPIVLTHLI